MESYLHVYRGYLSRFQMNLRTVPFGEAARAQIHSRLPWWEPTLNKPHPRLTAHRVKMELVEHCRWRVERLKKKTNKQQQQTNQKNLQLSKCDEGGQNRPGEI